MRIRPLQWMGLAVSLALAPAVGLAEAPDCAKVATDGRTYEIDRVWSGTRTTFAGVASGEQVFIAYYDPERWLTVARLDREKKQVCKVRLDTQFSGWDSHRHTTIAMGRDGSLHVAANMHASPLTYALGDAGKPLASLRMRSMTGKNERHVTYPTFLDTASGLLFAYRSGSAGNGDWLLNRWNGKDWSPVRQIYVGTDAKGARISAYPSKYVLGDDGYYHVAIAWRRGKGAQSNFALTYARTRDFEHWEAASGRRLKTPLSPEDGDVVDLPGEHAGFQNNTDVGLAHGRVPVVVYTRYAEDGSNQVMVARPDGDHWRTRAAAKAKRRTEIKGGGTIGKIPRFSIHGDDVLKIHYEFPGEEPGNANLDADSLDPTSKKAARADRDDGPNRPPEREARDLVDPQALRVAVREVGHPETIAGHLMWWAQQANRDRPRECTKAQPLACKPPPTTLRYVPGSGGGSDD